MDKKQREKRAVDTLKIAVICFWILLIIALIVFRRFLNLETLQAVIPSDTWTAFWIVMLLFALKSMSVFIYQGFLYILDGLLFPSPLSILVSLAGSTVMVSVPYWLGRWLGSGLAKEMVERIPVLAKLEETRIGDDFSTVLMLRMVGRIPSDPFSLFCGVHKIQFWPYLGASLISCVPAILTMPLIGHGIAGHDWKSVLFGVVLSLAVFALTWFFHQLFEKKRKVRQQVSGEFESEQENPD